MAVIITAMIKTMSMSEGSERTPTGSYTKLGLITITFHIPTYYSTEGDCNLQGGCVAGVTTCREGMWQGSQPAGRVCGRGHNLQGGCVARVTTSRPPPVL